jgi:DNA-binding NtrC family response regulator
MPLARFFLERAASRCQRHVVGISPQAESRLMLHGWPGNVRELENAIERAVVLGESDVLLQEDLPETLLGGADAAEPPGALVASVTESKRQLILAAWREAGGDHNQAAARLNIHPNSLRRLIRTLNLRDALS